MTFAGTSEHATCAFCGSREMSDCPEFTRMIHSRFRGRVVRCGRCSLTFLHPAPSEEETRAAYEEPYFEAYRQAGERFPGEQEDLPLRFHRRLHEARANGRPGRLLEVGVGHGSFLQLARQQGWDVHGLDVSRYVVRAVKERLGLDVVHGTLQESGFPDGTFDVVHLSHVLEHLSDPLGGLTQIRRMLKPQGLLLVEVPNEFQNLHVRLRRLVRLRLEPYSVSSTHVYFYSPATLERMLGRAGYAVRAVRTVRDTRDPLWTRSLLKRAADVSERLLGMGPLIEARAVKA